MLRPAAAVCAGLLLSQLSAPGGAVTVFSRPGALTVSLPCSYHYEDVAPASRLSVQWRSPGGELLCHFIKHKAFRNCSAGYDITYRPRSIQLTIRQVTAPDFGTHVCSVSEPHHFSDVSVELLRTAGERDDTAFVTTAPTGGVSQSGITERILLLVFLCLLL